MHFIMKVEEITGIDNSEGILQMLKKIFKKANVYNIDFMLFDVDTDILPENKYNLAVSSMTFHHIENTEKFKKY